MIRTLYLATLCMAATLVFAPAALAQTDLNCTEDFDFQEDAQAVLEADPSDPNGLDGNDNDGIACEELPSRGTDTGTGTGATCAQYQGHLDCADFASQAEAQAVLDADPSDPNGLDADNDGIACEETLSAPPTQATQQYEQPVAEVVDEETSSTTTTTPLPDTGGLPLVPLAGASLLVLGVVGLAVRRRIS